MLTGEGVNQSKNISHKYMGGSPIISFTVIRFSLISHTFRGTTIFGNPHIMDLERRTLSAGQHQPLKGVAQGVYFSCHF